LCLKPGLGQCFCLLFYTIPLILEGLCNITHKLALEPKIPSPFPPPSVRQMEADRHHNLRQVEHILTLKFENQRILRTAYIIRGAARDPGAVCAAYSAILRKKAKRQKIRKKSPLRLSWSYIEAKRRVATTRDQHCHAPKSPEASKSRRRLPITLAYLIRCPQMRVRSFAVTQRRRNQLITDFAMRATSNTRL